MSRTKPAQSKAPKPRPPAIALLIPTDQAALVFDSTGWHLAPVPPAWWIAEREAELEGDVDELAAMRERRRRAHQRERNNRNVRAHRARRRAQEAAQQSG